MINSNNCNTIKYLIINLYTIINDNMTQFGESIKISNKFNEFNQKNVDLYF